VSLSEPAFEAPWHAQLFALTVHLNETGRFTWPEWAETFGATLRQHGLSKELNGGEDYFMAWLDALETLLVSSGTARLGDLSDLKEAWTQAYVATPHGVPVRLKEDV
jgi:nitrile hydratase accessory protein